MVDTSKVNRFEIIDHTPCRFCLGTGKTQTETDSAAGQSISFNKECTGCGGSGCTGRTVVVWDDNKQIDLELQDDDQTLKVFIHQRRPDGQ